MGAHDRIPDGWRTLLVVAVVFVVVAAPVALGAAMMTTEVSAQGASDDNRPTSFVYSAKFLCGTVEGPDSAGAVAEPPVKPGNYATDIDIHNFQNETVELAVTVTTDQFRRSGETQTLRIGPDSSTQLSCRDLVELLGREIASRSFVKGFVEVETETEVEIAAVYTSKSVETRRESPDVGTTVDLRTGVEEDTQDPLANGTVEDDWFITADPLLDTPRDAIVVNTSIQDVRDAYPNGHDRAPDDSRLISVNEEARPRPLSAERLNTTYVRDFTLPENAKNPMMNLIVAPDDLARIYLNGEKIGETGGQATFQVTDGFEAGENRLAIEVQDGGVVGSLGVAGNVTADAAGSVGTGTGMSTDVTYIEPHVVREAPGGGNGNGGGDDDGPSGGHGNNNTNGVPLQPLAAGSVAGVLGVTLAIPAVRRRRN